MFLKHSQIAPARVETLLKAAESAARRVPPAFPLSATVAVNPFLGQTDEDLATAAARMERVAGLRLTPPRSDTLAQLESGSLTDDDLACALIASASPLKPADLAALKAVLRKPDPAPVALPTVTLLAARATGIDLPALVDRAFGAWAAGHFDQGQALWTPAPGLGAFAAWRAWASRDLTPEIAGLKGFCAHVETCPDTADRAILRACETLGITDAAAPTLFHRLLVDLGGWAMHARYLLWQAEQAGESCTALTDLLAIRLMWEEAAYLQSFGIIAGDWAKTVTAHEAPVTPAPDHVADAILQEACERAHQRALAARITGTDAAFPTRPKLQAAFCIDVRSEVFRRALESLSPEVETIGFAGFFGLPVAHRACGSDLVANHLPVLLTPALTSTEACDPVADHTSRIAQRTTRAWGRFRQAAVSSFAFIEAAGPFYGAKLVKDALGLSKPKPQAAAPQLAALEAATKAQIAAKVLTAMGLTANHAPLILLLGHGASTTNNPHDSAYHCGACGGQTGEVSARLTAALLNDPEARAGLPALGLTLPNDTVFVAGLHDTTTDEVTLYDLPPATPALTEAQAWLAQAGTLTRAERSLRLPGAAPMARAANWAEVRPEWGLAGCAAFIAAPRAATRGTDLGGRAFLHSYDWQTDAGFATLELILTAPVVVASWISLQYYGSTVAPRIFGGGDKLLHNVTGGIGVVEGNGGQLRAGLPWQAVHDGTGAAHQPLRLSVLIEAPAEAMDAILSRHAGVRALFENGWLHLLRLDQGKIVQRLDSDGSWRAA